MNPFDWRDGERRIVFGRGRVAEAVELAGGPGFVLLTTARAGEQAPELVGGAGDVVMVPAGKVDEVAGALLAGGPLSPATISTGIDKARLVAFGGGRVIDVAKAVAAARRATRPRDDDPRLMAIPTTLSGAEMTRGHRHAQGTPAGTPNMRPAVVVNDPALSASQPVPELAASALNALGHALEGPLTPKASPVPTLAAREGARLLVRAFDAGADPDRDALALGALLAGYAIDSQGYGLHHVLSQTIVREAGIAHGTANAILLPHTARALRERFGQEVAALDAAIGEPVEAVAERLCALTGTTTLSAAGVTRDEIESAARTAAKRPDLHDTPPAATHHELLTIYEAAL
jgi:alcohol dehydrogenase class IV